MDLSLDDYIKQKNITGPTNKIPSLVNINQNVNKHIDVRSRLSRPSGSQLAGESQPLPIQDARSKLNEKNGLDLQDVRHKLTKRNPPDAREKLNQRRGLNNQQPHPNFADPPNAAAPLINAAPLIHQPADQFSNSVRPQLFQHRTPFSTPVNQAPVSSPQGYEPLKVRIQGYNQPQTQAPPSQNFALMGSAPLSIPMVNVPHTLQPNNLSQAVPGGFPHAQIFPQQQAPLHFPNTANAPPSTYQIVNDPPQATQQLFDNPVYIDQTGQVIQIDSQEVYDDSAEQYEYNVNNQSTIVHESPKQAIPVQLSSPPAYIEPQAQYVADAQYVDQQSTVVAQNSFTPHQNIQSVQRSTVQPIRRPTRIYIKNPNSVDNRMAQPVLRSSSNTRQPQSIPKVISTNRRPAPKNASPVKASAGYKVFITNLVDDITDADIKELFGSIGTLRRARLLGQGKAEAVYVHKEHAISACKQFNSRSLDGQPIRVRLVTTPQAQNIHRVTERRSAPGNIQPTAQLGLVQKALFSR